MLVISRKTTESVMIGDHLLITFESMRTDSVCFRIGKSVHQLAVRQSAEIETGVTLRVCAVRGNQARIAIGAARHISINRLEVYERIKAEQAEIERRASMQTRVGTALCGLFVALSAWPVSVLMGALA